MPDFSQVDQVIQHAISDGAFPGACYAIGHSGDIHIKSHGRYMYCPDSPEIKNDTLWDMASCSKVVGCTTAAMICFDRGLLTLDQKVADVLPDFAQNDKGHITVRNLLLHNSGLVADLHNVPQYTTADDFMAALYACKLSYPTGTKMVYSDLSMITLGKMIEKLTGQTLDAFLAKEVFQPLGMADSMYNPPENLRPRCAPTETVEPWREKLRQLRHQKWAPVPGCHPDAHLYIQGEVHDPSACVLGGISGNAGLFSTAPDLARFAQFMLSQGIFWGKRLVKSQTIATWTVRPSDTSSRALGWDTHFSPRAASRASTSPTSAPTTFPSSAGPRLSPRAYGHTGYTGTSIWIDPPSQLFAVLLTNRVHPTSNNLKISKVRPAFHTAVADAFGI